MLGTPQIGVVYLDLHAVELPIAALGVPLVHAGGLVGEVENFGGSDRIATHRGGAVQEGGHEAVAFPCLAVINAEQGIDLQDAVHRGAHGDVA